MNITDPEYNRPAVHLAFIGKLRKPEFRTLLTDTGLITAEELEEEVESMSLVKITPAIDAVCDMLTERIRAQNLGIPPVFTFRRLDGISGKVRTLNKESAVQQVYEYIAQYALQDLFHAKILPCQYGSIPGKGQVNGTQKIEKIIRQKSPGGRVDIIKGDIHSAYQSVTIECVMRLLRRDIGKNKPLLEFVEQVMANYPEGRLMIGGYLPTWLFNYTMSYVLRNVMSYSKDRRGKIMPLVSHVVCYADDFALFGHRSNLEKAVKKTARWAKKVLGLKVKTPWSFYRIEGFKREKELKRRRDAGEHVRLGGIDMMGYRIFATHTIIRKRIFRRIRRVYLRGAARLASGLAIPYRMACRITSYNGWLVHSGSRRFMLSCNGYAVLRAAKAAGAALILG